MPTTPALVFSVELKSPKTTRVSRFGTPWTALDNEAKHSDLSFLSQWRMQEKTDE